MKDRISRLPLIPKGGMVGTGAVKRPGSTERQKAGKKCGVLMLLFIGAFVSKKGTSLLNELGGRCLPWMRIDASGFCFYSVY